TTSVCRTTRSRWPWRTASSKARGGGARHPIWQQRSRSSYGNVLGGNTGVSALPDPIWATRVVTLRLGSNLYRAPAQPDAQGTGSPLVRIHQRPERPL